MVDLRYRPGDYPTEEMTPQEHTPDTSITPPALDLMERLKEHFAIYLPESGPAGVVSDLVAEQRGAWRVINYLQSLVDGRLNTENKQ